MNKILQIECLELLKSIPDESVDLVFTDPPYNVSQKAKAFKDYRRGGGGKHLINMDFGEWDYNFNPELFLIESKRILKPNGSIIVWSSEQLIGTYRNWFEKNMYPKQMLVFIRTNPIPQFRLAGYRQATELMYWAIKEKNYKDNPNFNFLSQEEMLNVFYAPICSGNERTKHPTQKPLSITEKIIRIHSQENGIVVDPFCGSGTTAVACVKLHRNFICGDISEEYIKIANKRLLFSETALFV
ncbi:MAG: DNA-methyltransferase [bacterium]